MISGTFPLGIGYKQPFNGRTSGGVVWFSDNVLLLSDASGPVWVIHIHPSLSLTPSRFAPWCPPAQAASELGELLPPRSYQHFNLLR